MSMIVNEAYDYGIDTFYTSNSTQALFRSCARKVEFTKFYQGKKREEYHTPAVGTCLHNGFQSWLANKNYDLAMFEMMKTYPFHLQEQDSTKVRTIFSCYATLDEMIRSRVFDGWEIAKIKKADGTVVPAVEVPFEILLEGVSISKRRHIPVVYRGKIDCILYHPILKIYGAYDIKSTRKSREDMTPEYMFDEQVLPYALVLERLLDKEIDKLQVNYLYTYIDLKKPKVENYPFTKHPKDIEDWARGLILDIELMSMFYDMGWFKRNPNACSNSYGRNCGFFDVCHERDPKALKLLLSPGDGEKEFKEDYFGEPWVKMSIEMKEAA